MGSCVARLCAGISLVALFSIATVACTNGQDTTTGSRSSGQDRVGGTLTIASESLPTTLDPLATTDPDRLELLSQVVEPLVQQLVAPEGHARQAHGLALRFAQQHQAMDWQIWLRRNVRFQDHSSLSAAAVAANFRRWRTTPAGRALLPGLQRVTYSDQGVVRLSFKASLPDLPRRLASPRLGILAPSALRPPTGVHARFTGSTRAGSGAFAIRRWADRSTHGLATVLVSNDRWWGGRLGLGPSLSRVIFNQVPVESGRLAALLEGRVDITMQISEGSLGRLLGSNNLQALPGPGGLTAGVRRAVRGFKPSALAGLELSTVPLSQVWLTYTNG